ncbi:MAG: hypothetical protein Q7T05_05820 [Dehalococcoidia bacterium]|nr:hypothetical protein [Dehalococcoidia bacterium]
MHVGLPTWLAGMGGPEVTGKVVAVGVAVGAIVVVTTGVVVAGLVAVEGVVKDGVEVGNGDCVTVGVEVVIAGDAL